MTTERPVSENRIKRRTAGTLPRRVGHYCLEAELGRGGMGTVYRAWDANHGRAVALKRIRPEAARQPGARARFRREARTAARLDHPGIVKFYGMFTAEGSDWIVMELVEGRRLDHLLRAGGLGPERARVLGLEVASAIAAAHEEGVVHRDLKASNVLVTPEGRAKILDFGLAKQVLACESESSISILGQVLGTPYSMSPEQALGHEVDLRSDLFSLGSLLYQMLTGVSPFRDESPVRTLQRVCTHRQTRACEIEPSIPRPLSDLVDRLLEKDPAHRPQQAGEVVAALRNGALPAEERPAPPDVTPTICIDSAAASRAIALCPS